MSKNNNSWQQHLVNHVTKQTYIEFIYKPLFAMGLLLVCLICLLFLVSCEEIGKDCKLINKSFDEGSFKFQNSICNIYSVRHVNACTNDNIYTLTRFVVCEPPIPGMIKGSQPSGKESVP